MTSSRHVLEEEMAKLVECVPNFSEGKDMAKIKEITDAAESSPGVYQDGDGDDNC